MSATGKNLEAIDKGIKVHAKRCPGQIIEIRMAYHEVERLDFDDFRGIPIVGSDEVGTGRFKLVCDLEDAPSEPAVEAVSEGRTVTV